MPKTTHANDAANRIAQALADRTIPQISGYLNDQCVRAKLEHGDAHTLALDHIARLVTALRQQDIWPVRHDGGVYCPQEPAA